ncbi:hypothetical protein E4U53_002058, partial [Claviceps sorghi]
HVRNRLIHGRYSRESPSVFAPGEDDHFHRLPSSSILSPSSCSKGKVHHDVHHDNSNSNSNSGGGGGGGSGSAIITTTMCFRQGFVRVHVSFSQPLMRQAGTLDSRVML